MPTHAKTPVNGIIQTKEGYAVRNFMDPDAEPIRIGRLAFPDYETAVNALCGEFYPKSYRPYFLAAGRKETGRDCWENMVFIGHKEGYFDHESQRFRNAREMDMNAAGEAETAYLDALEATHKSILSMTGKGQGIV